MPEGVREHFAEVLGKRGRELRTAWESDFQKYRQQFPLLADEIERMQKRELPDGWDNELPVFTADPKGLASRDSSSQVLNAIAKRVPWVMGGSADLTPSTKTRLTFEGAGDFQAGSRDGRNLHFGIREHAMAAILNGMSLVKVRPYGSGFFIFSDYARGAIRLGALMELPIIHIFTHDSIGVGEDGPTHQPIEQLANLRSLPGLLVIRPCDANEVVEAWKVIMKQHHTPVALILTRQALPTLGPSKIRRRKRPRARCVHPGRCAEWQSRCPPARYRKRGRFVRPGLRATCPRGNQGSRRQHALLAAVRSRGSNVSR